MSDRISSIMITLIIVLIGLVALSHFLRSLRTKTSDGNAARRQASAGERDASILIASGTFNDYSSRRDHASSNAEPSTDYQLDRPSEAPRIDHGFNDFHGVDGPD